MKKKVILVTTLILVTIIAVGGTYAFLSSIITRNTFNAQSHKLEVIYRGDTEINGLLELVKSKEAGYRREVSIGLSENSVGATANLFIYIETITSNLAVTGLKWEIYRINGESETYVNSGTFMDCGKINETKTKCSSGKSIYMVNNLELSTTPAKFAVYIWLNGDEVNNSVLDGMLKGYIAAETENITGQIS